MAAILVEVILLEPKRMKLGAKAAFGSKRAQGLPTLEHK